jgi:hypothetical protein
VKRYSCSGPSVLAALLTTVGVAGVHRLLDEGDSFAAAPPDNDKDRTTNVRFLETSNLARSLLNRDQLWRLIKESMGNDEVLLSRCDLLRVRTRARSDWQRATTLKTASIPDSSLIAGISLYLPFEPNCLEAGLSTHRMRRDAAPVPTLTQVFEINPGSAALLADGTQLRLEPGTWMRLSFVRSWIKPDVFFAQAISKQAMSELGEQARRWCGVGQIPPNSLEAVLGGEEESLASPKAQGYGKGI